MVVVDINCTLGRILNMKDMYEYLYSNVQYTVFNKTTYGIEMFYSFNCMYEYSTSIVLVLSIK